MTPPLKVKDWLKEQSEKQFVFIHKSITGRKRVSRLKDNEIFREGENVGLFGVQYKILEFSPNLLNVHIRPPEPTEIDYGSVEINAIKKVEEIHDTQN